MFKGAVLVENKKIEEACRRYNVACGYWDENILPAVKKLKEEWSTLGWWDRHFKTDAWDNKAILVLKWKYGVEEAVSCYYHFETEYTPFLYKAGLITEDVFENMKGVEGYLERDNAQHKSDLTTMVTCGEPVYLNVEQCKFVNRFHNLDVKEMENGWTVCVGSSVTVFRSNPVSDRKTIR